MTNFNDLEYAILIGNLLHDTKYVAISNMGKMAGLRKHAEVMVRKILNIGSNTKMMLGQIQRNSKNDAVNEGIKNLGNELSTMLIETVSKINPLGNDGTHTQHTNDFTDEEIEAVEDAILDLYALIFIRYFEKYQVNLYFSPQVLREFSYLPPIIRYKTWKSLYKKDENNIQVVNRLCLSIIKTFNKDTAYKWLNENSEKIKAIPYPTDSEIVKYITECGAEISPGKYLYSILLDRYDNMYDLLYAKITDSATSINESGKMYKTFEEAIDYYKNYQELHIPTNSEEVKEFHSLMNFVFLGRKSTNDLSNGTN